MALTKDEIFVAALALDPDDRRELAEDIFQSIDDGPLTAEQRQELRDRADAIDRGDMTLVPADEALRRLA
jgi:putative addiction module component (TIGR02574 family)